MELKKRLSAEYKRHKYVLMGDTLTTDEKERFEAVCSASRMMTASTLTRWGFCRNALPDITDNNTIILIDEYDVPLENAYLHGFYDNMIGFIRSAVRVGAQDESVSGEGCHHRLPAHQQGEHLYRTQQSGDR